MTDVAFDERPIVRLADAFRRLKGWRRNWTAVAMGALASIALPPADALPLLWIALPALLWLLDATETRKGSFWVGWCFGFGYLALSLYWLTFALFVAIDQYWWLVPFASSGLAFGLSIYWGFGTWLLSFVPKDRPLRRILALVALVSLAEWVRGHALTGFPWNLPGYVWTEFPWLIQTAAWVGIYGVTVLALLPPALAGLAGSRLVSARQGWSAFGAGLALMAALALAGAIRLPTGPVAAVPNVRIRLVQPSIQQTLKWVPAQFAENLRRHIELSQTPADKPPTVIVWSEAAEPYPLDNYPDNAKFLGSMLKPGQVLVTGVDRYLGKETAPEVRDSMEMLDSAGTILATYDKFHYVPFGEYMPLGRYLPFIKAVAASSMDPTPGPGPVTVHLPGLPPAGPLICYEVIFPGEVVDPKDRPQWLLDVTNDAWFGKSAGPHQHFAMMRVRAVEEGLPLANAANDGISGVVDPYGRVTAKLGIQKVGVVDADLPVALDPTLFEKLGDLPFFAMIALLALAGFLPAGGRGSVSQPPRL
jgi:apolipoprotein N-acyltransferase